MQKSICRQIPYGSEISRLTQVGEILEVLRNRAIDSEPFRSSYIRSTNSNNVHRHPYKVWWIMQSNELIPYVDDLYPLGFIGTYLCQVPFCRHRENPSFPSFRFPRLSNRSSTPDFCARADLVNFVNQVVVHPQAMPCIVGPLKVADHYLLTQKMRVHWKFSVLLSLVYMAHLRSKASSGWPVVSVYCTDAVASFKVHGLNFPIYKMC